ncbi:Bug family tripartite tricarboxylate transporter substrate binding protein [Malikia spinosa]|uniref:Tripartite tricarboxylate transporter substrate binding protein n=1 Tax=Malikia spinosa TaxID=86180 RepID=A0A7C9IYF4_9BURK|nr:tripartite tricarboxylate transporter substrate binding protein [Malikia spinosa]MYZ52714.1 tripartite tricarboxylate transporter substrate binding protein [Malikia spinosa]OGB70206.1 MAG: ABC transporter substrate-binding protein [Burkholderiales bacterium RIFOXYC12_FULL_65_23]
MQRKKFFQSLIGLALAGAGLAAQAQNKPLEWVIGYPAGGGSDVVARMLADSMAKSLGRVIIVTNKPGAGTNIAAEYVARSRDPGNIMFTADFATLAANPTLFSKLNYNAEKDFQPVGLLARFPMFLAVANSVPANNLKEFTVWAKAQQDGVNWGSAGLGSPHHLIGELFREQSGLKLTHVPYKGVAPGVQDLAGGQIPAMWLDSAAAYPFANGKRIKLLAVASPKRLSTLPEVATLQEQGIKGFEAYAWQGLVVPTATPPEQVKKLADALQGALAQTAIKARMQAMGLEPLPGTPAQMAAYTKSERQKWGALIGKVGVKLD